MNYLRNNLHYSNKYAQSYQISGFSSLVQVLECFGVKEGSVAVVMRQFGRSRPCPTSNTQRTSF